MKKVILDETALQKLRALLEPALLCDDAGRVIGQFDPATCDNGHASNGQSHVPFSEDQLESFAREPGGRALSDILADLEKLP